MSQTTSSNKFLAADGKRYTADGKYVLENGVWVLCQSADASNQPSQPSQAQLESSLSPVSGDDMNAAMSAAMYAPFGLSAPSHPQLPHQPAPNLCQPVDTPGVWPMDVDPSFRVAKDRHPMIGGFVDAMDTITGR